MSNTENTAKKEKIVNVYNVTNKLNQAIPTLSFSEMFTLIWNSLAFRFHMINSHIFGIKNTTRIFTKKDVLEFTKRKMKGRMLTYNEVGSFYNQNVRYIYQTESSIKSDMKSIFNSYADHKTIDEILENAKDYSSDPDLVEVQYKKPKGWFKRRSSN